MKHMSLDEWDQKVGPYLASICTRATWIVNDTKQISEWIKTIPAVPNFETEAQSRMLMARQTLMVALKQIENAIDDYGKKTKVT